MVLGPADPSRAGRGAAPAQANSGERRTSTSPAQGKAKPAADQELAAVGGDDLAGAPRSCRQSRA